MNFRGPGARDSLFALGVRRSRRARPLQCVWFQPSCQSSGRSVSMRILASVLFVNWALISGSKLKFRYGPSAYNFASALKLSAYGILGAIWPVSGLMSSLGIQQSRLG